MRIALTLSAEERLALRRFAEETGEELDAAAAIALREFLISVGMLDVKQELAEDTETQGEA